MSITAQFLPPNLRPGQGGDGIAQQAAKAMNLPPLNLNAASSAGTGDVWSTFANDVHGGAFSVNYGNGVSQGGGVSGPIGPISPWLIGALIVGALLWKKRST